MRWVESGRSDPCLDRSKRVKDAKSEATKEVDEYRQQKEEEFKKMAELYSMEVERVKEMFDYPGGIDSVKRDVTIRKTIEFLVKESKEVPKSEQKEESSEDKAETNESSEDNQTEE